MPDLSLASMRAFRITSLRTTFTPSKPLELHVVLTLRLACNDSLTNHILYFLHISSRIMMYLLPHDSMTCLRIGYVVVCKPAAALRR